MSLSGEKSQKKNTGKGTHSRIEEGKQIGFLGEEAAYTFSG